MAKPDPLATGLCDEELGLIEAALGALRRERAREWNMACDAADAAGKRQPSLRGHGIDDIKRLARRLGVSVAHWAD